MGSDELPNSDKLTSRGLNLHAVFDIKNLTPGLKQQFDSNNVHSSKFRQLVLIGHGGTRFWDSLRKSKYDSKNPVDDYTCSLVNDWFEAFFRDVSFKIVYPGPCKINLQSLGQLAGWHHQSPFMLGINNQWGTWFAYRALILADSDFALQDTTKPTVSPCNTCNDKTCITCCPANAVSEKIFSLEKCTGYRKQENSLCQNNCLSRVSCPVATGHRYNEDQLNYHYSRSMQTLSGQS